MADLMHGVFPEEYVLAPQRWSLADAYAQMNRFTYEEFIPGELSFVTVLLPPLKFESIRLRGLFAAPGVDAIHQLVPAITDNFLAIANSRWASYPWAANADGYFVLYDNAARVSHLRNTRPDLDHIRLIPRQTADYTNEKSFRPRPRLTKDIDILVISRLHVMKHLPFLAKAILALRKKNPSRRYRVVWAGAGTKKEERDRRGLKIIQEMEATLGRLEDYFEPVGFVSPGDGMTELYARSKAFVLTSTVEGKNRALSEAMLTDVPVVVLNDFNAAARGGQPLLSEGAGLVVPRDPEQLAEALAAAVQNYKDFTPRASYLKLGGRKKFFWDCVLAFEELAAGIPGQTLEERGQWLSAALAANYGVATLENFLYSHHPASPFMIRHGLRSLNNVRGRSEIRRLLEALAL
jgi:glycosyltransferase involved in cell wall biosynthesis